MSVKATIQVRRGTTAQWSSANPILELGEPGYDLDLKILKVGDGITTWEDLEGISAGGVSLAIIEDRPPKPTDDDFDLGQFWVWSGSKANYLYSHLGNGEWFFIGVDADDPAVGSVTVYLEDPGTTVTLPLDTDVDVWVDWGDGTPITRYTYLFSSPQPSHTYASGGEYKVRFQGDIGAFGKSSSGSIGGNWFDVLSSIDTYPGTVKSLKNLFRQHLGVPIFPASIPNSVTSLESMFTIATNFNRYIGNWDTSNVTHMGYMFQSASSFNQDINGWDTGKVEYMFLMFNNATSFNKNLTDWNTSSVKSFEGMFWGASSFNGDVSTWSTQNVTDMSRMFQEAEAFNSDIGGWNTESVSTMSSMFYGASSFNHNLGDWDTKNVTNMVYMFRDASNFNGTVGGWNTSSVTSMVNMFLDAVNFNQDVSGWNVSSVTNMAGLFRGATNFNQDVSGWNTTSATNMAQTFYLTSAFDQDLSGWNFENVSDMSYFISNSGMSSTNYGKLLVSLASQDVKNNVTLGAHGIKYPSSAAAARATLVGKGWSISDGGQE